MRWTFQAWAEAEDPPAWHDRYMGHDVYDEGGDPIGAQSPPDSRGKVLPDFTDPATLGCLLALVREAREHPVWLEPADDFGGWLLMGCYAGPQSNAAVIADGPTEVAALVAALEAAP